MNPVSWEWTVPADHPALEGHFPGAPILPGVVWLDQVLQGARNRLELSPGPVRWPRVKFLRVAGPGQTVEIALKPRSSGFDFEIRDARGPLARGQCRPLT